MSVLLMALGAALCLSACFSGSETGMMALNRYHLNAWVASGSKQAILIKKLLDRPDRLLGIILIGNTLANNLAVALLNMVVGHEYGPWGMMVATVFLTLFMLVFVEVMPKTFAALQPKRVASIMAWPLQGLLTLLYPLVAGVNGVANGMLRLFGIQSKRVEEEPLGADGLKGLLRFGNAALSRRHRHMLFGVLDLDHTKVEEVMVPRKDIQYLDINQPWPDVYLALKNMGRQQWLVVDQSLDKVCGVLRFQNLLVLLEKKTIDKQAVLDSLESVDYVPEGISLSKQLLAFRQSDHGMALVVDEYGEVVGMLGLHDIIEEIIGHYAQSEQAPITVHRQSDGGYVVEGDVPVRDLNRRLDWQLPTDGQNSTLSGLVVEHLEGLPIGPVCLMVEGYPIEVFLLEARQIKRVKIWPRPDPVLES